MRRSLIAAALAFGAGTLAAPALACAVHEPLNLNSIRSADLVVVGRVTSYRVGRGGEFSFTVDEVLRGRAGRTLWMRFEFPGTPLPRARPGTRYLIALRNQRAGAHSILQHICSDPFLLEAASPRAAAARRLLPRGR